MGEALSQVNSTAGCNGEAMGKNSAEIQAITRKGTHTLIREAMQADTPCGHLSILLDNFAKSWRSQSMGGYGSTRWNWHNKRHAVEDCRKLPLRVIKRQLAPWQSGQVEWSRNGEVVSRIAFRVGSETSSLHLIYTITRANGEKQDVDYPIRLTTTPLPWGGLRHWFICPGARCGRRVSVLYLAPGGTYFLCRHCNRLSYRSRQEGYQDRALYGHLAGLMQDLYPGVTWRTMKKALKE